MERVLTNLAALDTAEQEALVLSELNVRLIFQDLDDYVSDASGDEIGSREAVRNQILSLLQQPTSAHLCLSNLHIRRLPASLSLIPNLKSLEISACTGLQHVHELQGLPALVGLSIENCTDLESLAGLSGLSHLDNLILSGCSNLSSLEGLHGLPELSQLYIDDCSSLQSLEGLRDCPVLSQLSLSDCPRLESIEGLSELPSLSALDMRNCPSLHSLRGLRELASLSSLHLESCESLDNLEDVYGMPALTSLSIVECNSLRNTSGLRDLPSFTHLSISACTGLRSLEGLHELRSLSTLLLEDCPSLENLEGVTNLLALDHLDLRCCRSLLNLSDLHNLPHLTRLSISACTNLQSVDGVNELPSLTSLHLLNCSSLQNLNDLHDLPRLMTLDISGCAGLQSVNLSGSTNLQSVRGLQTLPALTSLDLTGCTRLQGLANLLLSLPPGCQFMAPHPAPSQPSLASAGPGADLEMTRVIESLDLPHQVVSSLRRELRDEPEFMAAVPQQPVPAFSSFSQNFGRVEVARDVIETDPKLVLASIAHQVEQNPTDELIVSFVGEPGVDAGGLRKTLWTDLGKALFAENDPNKLPATRTGVNAEKPEGDGWIPTLRKDHEEEDRANLIRLGRLISWGASQDDPTLLLGPIFSPSFFRGLHAHINQQGPLVVLQEFLGDRSLALFNSTDWTDEEWPVVQAVAELTIPEQDEDAYEADRRKYIVSHLGNIKEAILAEPANAAYLEMIQALAEGLEQGSPGELDRLRQLSPAQIQDRYQGALDAERFIAALSCYEYERLASSPARTPQEQARLDLLTTRLEWLSNWIRNPLGEGLSPTIEQLAQSEELRRRLLNQITGRETLLDGEQVHLLIVGEGEPPSFHTCFNRLDLPVDIRTEAEFRQALTNLMAVQDEGYNAQ